MSSSYKRRNQLSNDLGTPQKVADEAGSDKNELSMSSDAQKDKAAKKFIDALRKVGPFSKHILNYSYPPLLYQRGDDEDEDDEEESQDQGECDDSSQNNSQEMEDDGMGQLPEFHDSDEELELNPDYKNNSGKQERGKRMPSDEEDQLLQQLKAVENDQDDKNSGKIGYYDHQVLDSNGDVILPNDTGSEIDLRGEMIDANEFSDGGLAIGGHATNLDGLDKEQILRMIDQEVDGLELGNDENEVSVEIDDGLEGQFEDFKHSIGHRQGPSGGEQHESTIINSS